MLTYEQKLEIVNMYQSGMTYDQIKEKYSGGNARIKQVLTEMGIEPRKRHRNTIKVKGVDKEKIKDMFEHGKISRQIAEELGINVFTVRSHLYKMGYNEKPIKNDHYFDNIDTEEKAYIFGLFCADGWLTKKNGVGIYLKEEDKYMVEKFASCFWNREPYYINGKTCAGYETCITLPNTSEKLKEYGITVRKSYELRFPKCVPEDLLPDFVRGYFDGDGCISGKQVSFVGTIYFIEELISVMSKYANVSDKVHPFRASKKLENNINVSICWSGIEQCKKIRDWMYRNGEAELYLKRKYEKFLRLN